MFVYLGFLFMFVGLFTVLFITSDIIYFYLLQIKHNGKPKKLSRNFKESSIFIKLFRDFPRLMGRYLYDRQFNFNDSGLIIFYGPQGSGKTSAVVHWCEKLCGKYPTIKVGSNFDLLIEDFKVKSWKQLVTEKNDDGPICFCIDELNEWADSHEWQKMPNSIISELCFNRKNHRVILGTAQNISQVNKRFRIQAGSGEYRRCFVIFDFINFVVRLRPEFDTDGNLVKKHFIGFYWFFQDEVLRYIYDTFRTIERLSECEKVTKNEN